MLLRGRHQRTLPTLAATDKNCQDQARQDKTRKDKTNHQNNQRVGNHASQSIDKPFIVMHFDANSYPLTLRRWHGVLLLVALFIIW